MNANNDVRMRLWILREKVRMGAIHRGLTPEFDTAHHAALKRMQSLQHERPTILCVGAHCTGGAGGGAVELKAWKGLPSESRKCAVCIAAESLEMLAGGKL